MKVVRVDEVSDVGERVACIQQFLLPNTPPTSVNITLAPFLPILYDDGQKRNHSISQTALTFFDLQRKFHFWG